MATTFVPLVQPRFGRARRPAAWLVAVALVVQCVFGSATTLRMSGEALDPLGIAQAICIDRPSGAGAPGNQDRTPAGSLYDHLHCLLCNAGLLAGTLPALASLPIPFGAEAPLFVAAQFAAFGKGTSRYRSRAPPGLA
jgi:hypothetical protein